MNKKEDEQNKEIFITIIINYKKKRLIIKLLKKLKIL